MKNAKSVVLLSGGLDSAVSLALAVKKGFRINLALTFDYGQKSAGQEIRAAGMLSRKYHIRHTVFNLKWLGKLASNPLTDKTKPVPHPSKYNKSASKPACAKPSAKTRSVWIPNRNALFINIAASFAEASGYQYIIAGFNKEEAVNFPDNSIQFINAINKTLHYSTLPLRSRLSEARKNITVISLTAKMDKKEIIKQGKKLGLPLDKLWSCYEGGKKQCGLCESCQRSSNSSS
ncbi:MAG: 7-cyano-7-deazaguanine synthase QueC [Planctomycetota bacterium]